MLSKVSNIANASKGVISGFVSGMTTYHFVEKSINDIDKNKDGNITPGEIVDNLIEKAKEEIKDMDKNKDGKISIGEIIDKISK